MPTPHLTKSRYLAGLQCDRRAWLAVHDPALADQPGDSEQHILRMGEKVGRHAHALFPDGKLVDLPPTAHSEAVEQTRAWMADEQVPAIFEAAFEYAGVRIRVDVLERLSGGHWGLREVKSSSSIKAEHEDDLAVQMWVLMSNGLAISSAELIHVAGDFVRTSGEIDWSAYFVREELIERLGAAKQRDVEQKVERMRGLLEWSRAPVVEPGSFCKKPNACPYWNHCTANKDREWRIRQTGASEERKRHFIGVTRSGTRWRSGELVSVLAAHRVPVWALDFEAIAPAIPYFSGTKPYQAIPFQWSLHRLDALGSDFENSHWEYLAEGREDPRPRIASSLVERLSCDDRQILVYSPYEKRCLRELAMAVPSLRAGLVGIERRLVDLLAIVKKHVYDPAFEGSFTIKKVGPALAPGVQYGGESGVSEGLGALAAFASILDGLVDQEEVRRIRKELLDYCRLDTRALIEIYRALHRETTGPG